MAGNRASGGTVEAGQSRCLKTWGGDSWFECPMRPRNAWKRRICMVPRARRFTHECVRAPRFIRACTGMLVRSAAMARPPHETKAARAEIGDMCASFPFADTRVAADTQPCTLKRREPRARGGRAGVLELEEAGARAARRADRAHVGLIAFPERPFWVEGPAIDRSTAASQAAVAEAARVTCIALVDRRSIGAPLARRLLPI
jgi:hypothetical protein